MEENGNDMNDDEQDQSIEEESIKVVLIGESGVGKTSIIAQFTKGLFNQDIMSTNGATFSTKKKLFKNSNKYLSFEIWDTAGQEKYRSLAKMFFKDATVALIVYDITNTKSFNEIKDYWLNLVRENGPKKIIMYIVGNKCDLSDREAVKEEIAREYAKSENVPFWLTSAKDSIGIDELFEELGNKYLSPDFNDNDEIKERKIRKKELANVTKDSIIEKNPNQRRGCCS
jgi:small GTP-binding protein